MRNRIAVSVGNSRISCGLFASAKLSGVNYYPLEQVDKAFVHIARLANENKVERIALSSVVPKIRQILTRKLASRELEIFEVSSDSQNIVTDLYPTLGADRIANAAAAFKLYAKKHPVAVLDFGTATTMTVVSETGNFLGGLITLGLGTTIAMLHSATAQLPDLEHEFIEHRVQALAKDTERAIASGSILAHVGLVQHWIESAKESLQSEVTVIGTGGYCEVIRKQTDFINKSDPYLTLKGVDLIAEAARS